MRGSKGVPREVGIRYWEIGEYLAIYTALIDFMDCVLNTDQVPFEIRGSGNTKTAVRIPVSNRKQKSLAGFFRKMERLIHINWPGRVYSPDFQLFFDCLREFKPITRCSFFHPSRGTRDRLIEGEVYNSFIAYLRREAVLRNVRKKVSDWRGNLNDQAASIRAYIAALSAAYRTLLIVRADLYYSEGAWGGSEAVPLIDWKIDEQGVWIRVPSMRQSGIGIPEAGGRIDTAIAMRHRDRFLENRRGADKDLFAHMVGYLTKMETGGKRRSNHFHCFFFFDGSKVKDIDNLVNGIRDRWHRTTNGLGMVYDSRNRLDRPALEAQGKWAIDPLNRGDAVGLARLQDYAAGYAAKDDGQMVRAKPASKARTLTMGRCRLKQ